MQAGIGGEAGHAIYPSAVLSGSPAGSRRRPSALAGSTAWVCQPPRRQHQLARGYASALIAAPRPRSGLPSPPLPPPARHTTASSMRPRMYGSNEVAVAQQHFAIGQCRQRNLFQAEIGCTWRPCGREGKHDAGRGGGIEHGQVSVVPASGKDCRHYAAAIPDGGHENSVPLPGPARVRAPLAPCSFGERGDLQISTADDNRWATPAPQRRIKHLRARRGQCEEILAKRLPKAADLRNIRVLGSDLAATKHVAE